MPITLSPDPKRNESAKISALLRRKNAVRVNGTRHDTTNDFGQSVTRPNLKLSIDFPSITSSSKTTSNSTSDSVVVVVYPMEHFSSTSVSHRGYDVPMIQPSVTQTSQSSVIHNDDNLDDQQNALETNNRPDPTPITQPLTLKMLSKPGMNSFLLNLVTPQVVFYGSPRKAAQSMETIYQRYLGSE
jgi:hypothetical protein